MKKFVPTLAALALVASLAYSPTPADACAPQVSSVALFQPAVSFQAVQYAAAPCVQTAVVQQQAVVQQSVAYAAAPCVQQSFAVEAVAPAVVATPFVQSYGAFGFNSFAAGGYGFSGVNAFGVSPFVSVGGVGFGRVRAVERFGGRGLRGRSVTRVRIR